MRRATSNSGRIFRETPNFYPRSPCGERPAQLAASQAAQNISIHALLAESDGSERILWPVMRNFYPRSPCGERPTTATTCVAIANFYPRSPCGERPAPAKTEYGNLSFLSTLSLRRATKDGLCRTTETLYFYPRSPCGERHSAVMCSALLLIFLSTLSLRRATQYWATRARAAQLFLSTLSLRRATRYANTRTYSFC